MINGRILIFIFRIVLVSSAIGAIACSLLMILSLHLTRLGRRAFSALKLSDWRSKQVLCQASGMTFTLHQLLTETAARQSKHDAVRLLNEALTDGQLDRLSGKLRTT